MYNKLLTALIAVGIILAPFNSARADQITGPNPAPATGATLYLPMVLQNSQAPTSYQLIDQALARGEIDSETALIYKVFADFSDPRLPAQYKGDDSALLEGSGISSLLDNWDSLSPGAQATLQPFFIPPIYAGSWYNLSAHRATSLPSSSSAPQANPQPPNCGPTQSGWISQDAKTANVRFWGKPGQEALLSQLASAVDGKIWGDLKTLFGDQPLSDASAPCNGGDGRLDIFLVNLGRSYTIPTSGGCSKTPAFILFDPQAYSSELTEITAHEMSHAFQFAYPVASCSDTGWIREATATYAQQYVYPTTQTEQRTAPWYLDHPTFSLNYRNDTFEYGAYTFFFYLSLTAAGSGIVKNVWQAMATQSSMDALDSLIPGGFKQRWPEFSLWNINRDPYLEFTQADALPAKVHLALDGPLQLPGKDLTNHDIGPTQMEHLTGDHVHITFPDPKARTVIIYNGWSFSLAPGPKPGLLDGSQTYLPSALSTAQQDGRALWIVPKVQGAWQPQDMTGTGLKVLCLDQASQRPDELYLVHDNYLKQAPLSAPDLPTTLFATNIGCWRWQGSITYSDGAFAMQATNLLWERDTPLGTAEFMYKLVQGNLHWQITAPGCIGQGDFDLATAQGPGTIMQTYNDLVSGNTYRQFMLHGDLQNPQVNVVCNGQAGFGNLPYWADSNPIDPTSAIQPDGSIDSTFNPGGSSLVRHVLLNPLRDP